MEVLTQFGPDRPIYLQLADHIEMQVRGGSLRPGERLPAERVICELFGVARGTAKNALRELQRRGVLEIRRSSGAYIREARQDQLTDNIRQLLTDLRQQGLSKWEVELLAKEAAWSELPGRDRIRVAWVDCSPELFRPLTGQIETGCHVAVTPFLLDDLIESPLLLAGQGFDFITTSINHFEELEPLAARPEYEGVSFDRMVLSLGRLVVSAVAGIRSSDTIAVFYDSAMYRRSVEMFLVEFGVRANFSYFPMRYGPDSFTARLKEWDLVILPPDPAYMDDMPAHIEALCAKNGIRALRFENVIDYGSLQSLKERAQRRWQKTAGI